MRSTPSRLRIRHLSTILGAFGLVSGCVAASNSDGASLPPVNDAGLGATKVFAFDSGLHDAAASAEGGLNSRCGTTNFCGRGTPDDPLACADYDGGPRPADRSEAGTVTADASSRGVDGGTDASDAGSMGSGDAGRDASFNAPDGADGGGNRRAALPVPGPLPPLPEAGPRFACQVGTDNSGHPVHQCGRSGFGAVGSPCGTVGDCQPGLGCVGSGESGLCFHYCCDPSTVCADRYFCVERPLLDVLATKKSAPPLLVPVCAHEDMCTLLEPYPCTGQGCSCPSGTTCAVVRSDGTRGCVKPGTGKVNEPCPCAAGYYCSPATSSCVKMCKTDASDNTCAPGKCQAAAGFPAGFGLCVGYVPATQ